jgi:multimeric flavodoxin WrbA
MKILAIIGSPHKGSGYQSVRHVERCMKSLGKVQFEYLFLKDVNLKMCAGCFQCLKKGQELCPLKDDRDKIIAKMLAADGIILSSPVYVMDVTAYMKNFIDRLAFSCHRPMFFKHGLAIANTGAIGQGRVSKYMADIMTVMGFWTVEKAGVVTLPNQIDVVPQKARKILEKSAARFYHNVKKDEHIPSLYSLIQYRVQQAVFQRPEMAKELPCDYEFYKSLKGRYRVDGEVGFFKNAIAVVVAKTVGLFT